MSKHRSDRQLTPEGRRKQRGFFVLFIVVGVLLLVTTLVVGVFQTLDQQQAPTMVRPSTTNTPSATVVPSASFGPTMPTDEPTASVQPVRVPGSLPVSLEVPQLNFRVQVEGNWLGSPINPPFDTDTADEVVYFDTSRGTRPGSNTSNSSYFAGHTCRGAECQSAFDVLDQRLQVGDDIFVTTVASEKQNVRLHYVVTEDNLYPRNSLPEADEVWAAIPNRLIFITCNLREDGAEQTDNHVFFARYIGSVS